jgi:hypothetical protein
LTTAGVTKPKMHKSLHFNSTARFSALLAGLGFIAWLSTTAAPDGAGSEGNGKLARPSGNPTFCRDIAPIMFNNCVSCHRAGEVGPFPLTSYADVKKRAKTIVAVTEKRFMPPWKAEPGFGDFHDVRLLAPDEISLIRKWYDGGAVEGDTAELPAMPKFTQGWSLGEPDLVLEPRDSYTLGAEGKDVYQCFVIPTPSKETRYVAALEVRPGNRSVVHHVIAYLDTTGAARKLDAADPAPGYTSFGGVGFLPSGSLGGWAPGNFPRLLPDGIGVLLPAGADVVLQVHYHRTGKEETDRTKIGIHFAKSTVDKRLRILPVAYRAINIPAGESNYTTSASLPIPAGIHVWQVMPHMHLLGKEMKVTASMPNGSIKPMVHIPDWDFNWQGTYRFKEALELPPGSRIDMTARFDNSAANPRNPSNPPRVVRRGEKTDDEMCMAFVYYTVDAEHITKGITFDRAPDRF